MGCTFEESPTERIRGQTGQNMPNEINAKLPNDERWFVPFWLYVLEVLEPGAKVAFLEMHQQKICDKGANGYQLTEEELRCLQRVMLRDILIFNAIVNPQFRAYLEVMITLALLDSLLKHAKEKDSGDRREENEDNK